MSSKGEAKAEAPPGAKQPEKAVEPTKPQVGIVMPISATDGCSVQHWKDVQAIVEEAVRSVQNPQFEIRRVNEGDAVEVIHKRIVQNVYDYELVVCDVSGRNPNVMFELGMRLAFDKPVVIIKDDATAFAYDLGLIEHLPYPRDLRYTDIVSFKEILAKKVTDTYRKFSGKGAESPFLGHFERVVAGSIKEREGTANEVVLDGLAQIQNLLRQQARTAAPDRVPVSYDVAIRIHVTMSTLVKEFAHTVQKDEPFISSDDLYKAFAAHRAAMGRPLTPVESIAVAIRCDAETMPF